MRNKRMFVARYLAPTDYRGARIKITDTRHKGANKTYSWDYELGYLTEQALAIFEEMGIEIEGYSEPWLPLTDSYFFTSNFETKLKKSKRR